MIPYDKIRKHYEYLTPLIMERSRKHPSGWASPYCAEVDWIKIFTPIEYDTWHSIRSIGRIPLYPQYPVLGFFLDFGNPFLKIGIECDGADFHLDKKKDNDRDYELKQHGWAIYRISGADCWRVPSVQYYDLIYHYKENRLDILNDFYNTTIDGLLRALSIHYCKNSYYEDEYMNERSIAELCLYKRVSKSVINWNQ